MRLSIGLLLAALFLQLGCAAVPSNNTDVRRTSSNPGVNNAQPVTPVQPSQPSLDDQALKQAKDTFENNWIKCGDSYFNAEGIRMSQKAEKITQLKDVSFNLSKDPVSDVDRMNGLEWSGTVNVQAKAMREYYTEFKYPWDAWKQAAGPTITVRKGKSGWDARYIANPIDRQRRPTCDEVAKIPERN